MEEGNRAELERNRHEAFAGVVQVGIIRRRDDDIPRTKVRIRFVTVVSADKFFNAGTRADRAVGHGQVDSRTLFQSVHEFPKEFRRVGRPRAVNGYRLHRLQVRHGGLQDVHFGNEQFALVIAVRFPLTRKHVCAHTDSRLSGGSQFKCPRS